MFIKIYSKQKQKVLPKVLPTPRVHLKCSVYNKLMVNAQKRKGMVLLLLLVSAWLSSPGTLYKMAKMLQGSIQMEILLPFGGINKNSRFLWGVFCEGSVGTISPQIFQEFSPDSKVVANSGVPLWSTCNFAGLIHLYFYLPRLVVVFVVLIASDGKSWSIRFMIHSNPSVIFFLASFSSVFLSLMSRNVAITSWGLFLLGLVVVPIQYALVKHGK